MVEKRTIDTQLNTSREENAKLRGQLSELQIANDRLNSAARQGKATGFFASLGSKLQDGAGNGSGGAAAAIASSTTLSTAAAIALAMRGGSDTTSVANYAATPNSFDSKYLRGNGGTNGGGVGGVGGSGGRDGRGGGDGRNGEGEGGGGNGSAAAMDPPHYPTSAAASPIHSRSRPASAATATPTIAVSPASPDTTARSIVSFRGSQHHTQAHSPTEALRAASEDTQRLVQRLEAENAALKAQQQQQQQRAGAAVRGGGGGGDKGDGYPLHSSRKGNRNAPPVSSGVGIGSSGNAGGVGGVGRSPSRKSPDLASLLHELRASGGGNHGTIIAEAGSTGSLIDLLGRHCENLSSEDPDLELVSVVACGGVAQFPPCFFSLRIFCSSRAADHPPPSTSHPPLCTHLPIRHPASCILPPILFYWNE